MIRKIFLLFSVFLSLVLSACSTTNGISKYGKPNLQEKGVLLLAVTDRALFTATGISFTIEDINNKKTVLVVNDWDELFSLKKRGVRKFFRAFELPEGNYKFTSWEFIRTQGKPAEKPKEPFEFSIKQGEVVYIGNFDAVRILGNGRFKNNYEEDSKAFQSLYSWLEQINIKKELLKPSEWLLPDGKKFEEFEKEAKQPKAISN
ncbi:hypothetical protein ACT2CV_08480 [Pasteurellaceae bacterium 22721_9_1]